MASASITSVFSCLCQLAEYYGQPGRHDIGYGMSHSQMPNGAMRCDAMRAPAGRPNQNPPTRREPRTAAEDWRCHGASAEHRQSIRLLCSRSPDSAQSIRASRNKIGRFRTPALRRPSALRQRVSAGRAQRCVRRTCLPKIPVINQRPTKKTTRRVRSTLAETGHQGLHSLINFVGAPKPSQAPDGPITLWGKLNLPWSSSPYSSA